MNRSSCYRAVLECTDACRCSGCKNRADTGQQELQDDDIEEDMQPDFDENVTDDKPSSDVEEDDDKT